MPRRIGGDLVASAAAPAVARRRDEGSDDLAPAAYRGACRARAGGGRCLQNQIRVRRCRPSASPSCAPSCGASRTLIASLRAEWSKLDRPDRLQELAQRHSHARSRSISASTTLLDRLPERPVELVPPGTADPIGAVIETMVDPERSPAACPTKVSRDERYRHAPGRRACSGSPPPSRGAGACCARCSTERPTVTPRRAAASG